MGPQWRVDGDETRHAASDREDEIGSPEKLQMCVFVLKITSAQWLGFQECFILSVVSDLFPLFSTVKCFIS